MKDMQGVMRGFAAHLVGASDAHLILAGPESSGVTDDPEANAVLQDCLSIWRGLPAAARGRIHLACVPMEDPDAAAAIVNALQRHAQVVVQKSLAEGFGLTVAEAMYKSRPVVGTAVGGIADQIVPGETGALIADPSDLDAFAAAVGALLKDPEAARRMGANGPRARCRALPRRYAPRAVGPAVHESGRALRSRAQLAPSSTRSSSSTARSAARRSDSTTRTCIGAIMPTACAPRSVGNRAEGPTWRAGSALITARGFGLAGHYAFVPT